MKFLTKNIKPIAFMLLAATCVCNANQLIDVASQSTFNLTRMQSTFTRDAMSGHWKKYVSEPFSRLDRKYQIGIGVLGAAVGATAAGYFGYKAFNTLRDRIDRVGAARRAVQRGDINRLRLAAQRALPTERPDIIDACITNNINERNALLGAVTRTFFAKDDFNDEEKLNILFPIPTIKICKPTDYIFLDGIYQRLEEQSPITLLEWIFTKRAERQPHFIPRFISRISGSFDHDYQTRLSQYFETNPIVMLCSKMPVAHEAPRITYTPHIIAAFNALFFNHPYQNLHLYYHEPHRELVSRQKACLKSLAQNFMEHTQDIAHAQNFIYLCNFVGFTPADWAPFRNFRCQNKSVYNLCLSKCNRAEAQRYASVTETAAASEPIAMQIPSDEDCNTASNDTNVSAPSAVQAATSAEEPIKVIPGAQTRESFARELIKQKKLDDLKVLISHPKYPIQDLNPLLAFARASEASDAIIACIKRSISVAVIQGDMSFRDAVNGRRIDLS